MDKKNYLEKLLELESFLKEHPEKEKIYRDVNVTYRILYTKREIEIEEEEVYEASGLDFVPSYYSPF